LSQVDFTEASYARCLDQARARFRFVTLNDDLNRDGIALWRHDIDMSPHRALRLAELEAERGLVCSYFVMFSSRFYNPFEIAITPIIRRIAALGHVIGLHFDAAIWRSNALSIIEERLAKEAEMLSALLATPINCFSLHNPTTLGGLFLHELSYAGLRNASATPLMRSFTYCSDSNGVWRHRRLLDVLSDPSASRLYALTHPEWWTANESPSRARVQRCIDGRARNAGLEYDADMTKHNRPNS
jgi:hypothetical protein